MGWSGWTSVTGAPVAADVGIPPAELPHSHTIRLAPGEVAIGLLPLARVAAGQWATAKIHMVSTSIQPARLRVLLAREGGEGDAFFKTFAKVKQDAQVVRVTGKFPVAQTALRVELKNMGASDAVFVAGRPNIRLA